MICWRVVALDTGVTDSERGGMLWFPRPLQGHGRHDNPDLYGCLYASTAPAGAIVESLAPFRGSGSLAPAMLRRSGSSLFLGKIVLREKADLIDLDDPVVLNREQLRPSQVATRARDTTQKQAAALYHAHPNAVALRWWSTIESTLLNLTIFDRGAEMLALEDRSELSPDHPAVAKAADLLGLTR